MIGLSPFSFASPSATRDFGAGPGFSSVENATSPVKLDPARGAFNIQKTSALIGNFFDGIFGPAPKSESETTEQKETAPPSAGITFNQQLVGAAVIAALVATVFFARK